MHAFYLSANFFLLPSKFILFPSRGGSRAAATSKMEGFVIIVNGFPSWMLQ